MDFLINFDKERFATFTHRQAEFTAFVGDTRCSPCEGVEFVSEYQLFSGFLINIGLYPLFVSFYNIVQHIFY